MTPDVNVLVAAGRPTHAQHGPALEWLRAATAEATRHRPLTILPTVAVGYVRVATNRRIYDDPAPIGHALGNIIALLAAPHVQMPRHGTEWPRVIALCEAHALAGDIVTDAWIAATVLELNEHLVTFDRGFRRLLTSRHLTVLTA